MADNLFSGIAGGLAGFAPFGRDIAKSIGKGISATPIERLWTAAEQEGASLAAIRKDLDEFGKWDLRTGLYKIETFYANRPATAKFMTEVLEKYLNPPDFEKMSPQEKEDYRKGTVDSIIALIETGAAAGREPIPKEIFAGMKPALAEKYTREGALEERYMPWGFEEKPELQKALFRGITGKEELPMTGTEMAEARRLGQKLGDYPLAYEKFQSGRNRIFEEISGTALQKSVMAMVSEGAEAAVLEPGWWIKRAGEKETAEEAEARRLVEKKHPFLKDKKAAGWLKVTPMDNGLIDWTTFSSANIESEGLWVKLDAFSYLIKLGGFTGDQLAWIFHNWFPGAGTPEQPVSWGGLGGEPLGGGQ